MRGGRAFNKPLPFPLYSNGSMFRYGVSTTDLAQAAAIGMQGYRNDVSWVVNQGSTPIEGLPGVYSSSAISNLVSVVNAVKSYGLKPLLVFSGAQNPGLCPTLTSALASGSIYTSIHVSTLAYAITNGDSIQLTTGPGGTVQTITAAASMSAGASGTLAVNSFTAAANFAAASSTVAGAWVYDTTWNASTPAHFAAMAAYVVAQTGLQGLDWELWNEPDGGGWGITAPLLYQMYSLAYPLMKAADSTCTIHGLVLEATYSNLGGQGSNYYITFAQSAGWTSGPNFHPIGVLWDDVHLHTYSNDNSYVTDASPWTIGPDGYNRFTSIALMRQLMVSMGDNSLIGISEIGWPNGSAGQMTPHLQAQFYLDLFTTLSGNDWINGGHFSDYITMVAQFAMENSGAAWGIIGEPAVSVLTQLVYGVAAPTPPSALPFALGGNVDGINYTDSIAIGALQACGMTYSRVELEWNVTKPSAINPAFETTTGTFSSSTATAVATLVAAHKAAGITPIIVVNSYGSSNPGWSGMCPTLNTGLTNGQTGITSISITSNGFAITTGDTITLTNPSTNATQTVTANGNLAAGQSGPYSLPVNSFTASSAFPAGSWVYDSAWPPCTPAQLATAMAWLVAQTGLQGLHWEIMNEPDGGGGFPNTNIAAALYTKMMQLVYVAMKAADSTCIIHGMCLESLSPTGLGLGDGTTYYNACVTAGILTRSGSLPYYDALSFHLYSETVGFTGNWASPDTYGGYGLPLWGLIANFRANMIAKGDTSPMWMTEFGWEWESDGPMTAYLQAQYFKNFLTTLSGYDPVNGVQFSSYLKGAIQYCTTAQGGSAYALFPTDSLSAPNPAVAILAQLVVGP
jgi:hypothetical protein